jgi:predicted ArsR family transcriptional regulator
MTTFNGQHFIDFDSPPAQLHSPTSVAAARSQTRQKREIDRDRVLAALAGGPLTDEEIAERTGLGPNTARPRRVELVREGLVAAVGEGRTAAGRKCVTWGRV